MDAVEFTDFSDQTIPKIAMDGMGRKRNYAFPVSATLILPT